jgi:hypothetical protein
VPVDEADGRREVLSIWLVAMGFADRRLSVTTSRHIGSHPPLGR